MTMKRNAYVEGGEYKHEAQVPPVVFVLNVERIAHKFVCRARRAEPAAGRRVLCRLFEIATGKRHVRVEVAAAGLSSRRVYRDKFERRAVDQLVADSYRERVSFAKMLGEVNSHWPRRPSIRYVNGESCGNVNKYRSRATKSALDTSCNGVSNDRKTSSKDEPLPPSELAVGLKHTVEGDDERKQEREQQCSNFHIRAHCRDGLRECLVVRGECGDQQ